MPRHNLPHAGGCLKSVPGGGTDFKLLPEHPHALEVDRCIWGTQMLHLGYPNVLVRLKSVPGGGTYFKFGVFASRVFVWFW